EAGARQHPVDRHRARQQDGPPGPRRRPAHSAHRAPSHRHDTIQDVSCYTTPMPAETSRGAVLAAARGACAGGRQPTMGELAAAAGVSVRTLYRLFGSRRALLRELDREPAPTARERLLAAALELVGQHGLAALSMDRLAAAAGVSRATLYRLFPGQPALFRGLIEAYSPWEPVARVLDAAPDVAPEHVIPRVGRALLGSLAGRTGVLLRMVV